MGSVLPREPGEDAGGVIRPLPGWGRPRAAQSGLAKELQEGARGADCSSGPQEPRVTACVSHAAHGPGPCVQPREPHRLFQDVANLEAREADSGTGEVASDFLTLAEKNTQGAETKKRAELTAEN